jgi:NAD(P) transhydrogenase
VVIVATGAGPVAPEHLAVNGKNVLDSDTILDLKTLPKSMVVLGGGVIGCEYASMFSMAGTLVTLVDKRPEILASVDREIVSHLTERFEHDRVDLVLGAEAQSIDQVNVRGKRMVRVTLTTGQKINAEVVLVALGRQGNTRDLGLESVGIAPDARGLIPVSRQFQTAVPSIYAVGDVVGSPALAATAYEQGRIACSHAFGLDKKGVSVETAMPEIFPYGIYTIPEISMIGKTESELIAEGAHFVAGRSRYKELARGQIVGDRWGLLKLLVDRKSLKILGVHIIGDSAADLIHIGQAVMALDGDVNYFIRSVFNYPTLAEAYKIAAFHAFNQIKGLTNTR